MDRVMYFTSLIDQQNQQGKTPVGSSLLSVEIVSFFQSRFINSLSLVVTFQCSFIQLTDLVNAKSVNGGLIRIKL